MIATLLIFLGLHGHQIVLQGGPVAIAIPPKCTEHARVYLNGRRLRLNQDIWVLPVPVAGNTFVGPSRNLELEWFSGAVRIRY